MNDEWRNKLVPAGVLVEILCQFWLKTAPKTWSAAVPEPKLREYFSDLVRDVLKQTI